MPARLVTAPTAEPISLAQAKAHLRVTDSAEDSLISSLITVVRQACEDRIRRTIVKTGYEYTAAAFVDRMALDRGPLLQVTSVKYLDATATLQTLAPSTYVVDQYAALPAVLLASGAAWPTVATGRPDAVRISYAAGYCDENLTPAPPAPLVHWMLLQLAHFFDNREASGVSQLAPLPYGDDLLHRYRLLQF